MIQHNKIIITHQSIEQQWVFYRRPVLAFGIVIACVCVCVRVCVCQSLACPRDNLEPVQASLHMFATALFRHTSFNIVETRSICPGMHESWGWTNYETLCNWGLECVCDQIMKFTPCHNEIYFVDLILCDCKKYCNSADVKQLTFKNTTY